MMSHSSGQPWTSFPPPTSPPPPPPPSLGDWMTLLCGELERTFILEAVALKLEAYAQGPCHSRPPPPPPPPPLHPPPPAPSLLMMSHSSGQPWTPCPPPSPPTLPPRPPSPPPSSPSMGCSKWMILLSGGLDRTFFLKAVALELEAYAGGPCYSHRGRPPP
ncbi:actin-binding protein WASF2-like isoform X6 [Trachinotus anak]